MTNILTDFSVKKPPIVFSLYRAYYGLTVHFLLAVRSIYVVCYTPTRYENHILLIILVGLNLIGTAPTRLWFPSFLCVNDKTSRRNAAMGLDKSGGWGGGGGNRKTEEIGVCRS